MLKSSLNPLVTPDQVRQLNITERLIQDEDHLVDRFAWSRQRGLQLREQRDKVPFESAEYVHIEGVLRHSGDGRGGEQRTERARKDIAHA